MMDRHSIGIRGKLIGIFVLIKVIPLLALAWFAWDSSERLRDQVKDAIGWMTGEMRQTIGMVSSGITDDAIRALDVQSREAIERLTTDTARSVAAFLYDRDDDIRHAAAIAPDAAAYKAFLSARLRPVIQPEPWVLSADGAKWEPAAPQAPEGAPITSSVKDNELDFHYRAPEHMGATALKPLFLEMTFIGLDGREKVKVTTSDRMRGDLVDVSRRQNTYVKAETYFEHLKSLKPGEIWVSDVIGAYVPTKMIGAYTPVSAKAKGIDFKPEDSAYAGMENPVGRKYQGLIRWATPVTKNGDVVGWVTLALDHVHLRELVDHIVPTDARYSAITDAGSGNYAFIWDYLGRSVVHPRHYFMTGYDPATGQPVVPWLEDTLYGDWKASGLPYAEWSSQAPTFRAQALDRKPSKELVAAGTVALDCRFLNFAPQCAGWMDLTRNGGSGSFVIKWSGLWKLTTAATIPYYTGPYAASPRGFGFVTIGANIDDFHRAATAAKERIDGLVVEREAQLAAQRDDILGKITGQFQEMARKLSLSTVVMISLVIGVAVWMAGVLTRRITAVVAGIGRFEKGDLDYRLPVETHDEMGNLALSLNRMADAVADSVQRLDEARRKALEVSRLKSQFLASVSHELRTPLNGILGFADLLRVDSGSEENRQHAQIIFDSGTRLVDFVNSILDIAKTEAGMLVLDPQKVAIRGLIDAVMAEQAAEIQKKGLSMNLQWSENTPEFVVCDPTRLRQILRNLLCNAVKFTDQGTVTVSVGPDGGGVRFAVADTGIGIAAENQVHLFENFHQVESFFTRSRSGAGLGLALAKNLVEAMGGAIGVRSEEGHGSEFHITLPVQAAG